MFWSEEEEAFQGIVKKTQVIYITAFTDINLVVILVMYSLIVVSCNLMEH